MNWPKELIIKRDISNTKIVNKDSIKDYIFKCYDLNVLNNYLSQLNNQTKLDNSEVFGIIEACQDRINKINVFLSGFENSKSDEEMLAEFYEKNYKFIEGMINFYIKGE